ncbi:MAG: hypothetical protein QOA08_07620 [Nitrososphaeraceae archaeon]|nr:hypothetical protein [Nitrososphaeraceae archaeon]
MNCVLNASRVIFTQKAGLVLILKLKVILETASMRDLICDHCGHRQKNAQLKEYGGPATEIVSGVVTKADPEDKEEK